MAYEEVKSYVEHRFELNAECEIHMVDLDVLFGYDLSERELLLQAKNDSPAFHGAMGIVVNPYSRDWYEDIQCTKVKLGEFRLVGYHEAMHHIFNTALYPWSFNLQKIQFRQTKEFSVFSEGFANYCAIHMFDYFEKEDSMVVGDYREQLSQEAFFNYIKLSSSLGSHLNYNESVVGYQFFYKKLRGSKSIPKIKRFMKRRNKRNTIKVFNEIRNYIYNLSGGLEFELK